MAVSSAQLAILRGNPGLIEAACDYLKASVYDAVPAPLTQAGFVARRITGQRNPNGASTADFVAALAAAYADLLA